MAIKSLKEAGFDQADREPVSRLITAIAGMDKEGKTHQGLMAPPPIALFSMDIGTDGVVQKFANKEIHVNQFTVPEDQEEAKKEWNRFASTWEKVLAAPLSVVRSVVVDTETELWELKRMASFGKAPAMPYMYTPVNAEYKRYVKMMAHRAVGKNIVYLRKMKQEYVNNVSTGKYVVAGFGDLRHIVQANLQAWRDDPSDGGAFHLYVKNCRMNPDVAGMDLEGEMCTLSMFASLAVEGTDVGDWE